MKKANKMINYLLFFIILDLDICKQYLVMAKPKRNRNNRTAADQVQQDNKEENSRSQLETQADTVVQDKSTNSLPEEQNAKIQKVQTVQQNQNKAENVEQEANEQKDEPTTVENVTQPEKVDEQKSEVVHLTKNQVIEQIVQNQPQMGSTGQKVVQVPVTQNPNEHVQPVQQQKQLQIPIVNVVQNNEQPTQQVRPVQVQAEVAQEQHHEQHHHQNNQNVQHHNHNMLSQQHHQHHDQHHALSHEHQAHGHNPVQLNHRNVQAEYVYNEHNNNNNNDESGLQEVRRSTEQPEAAEQRQSYQEIKKSADESIDILRSYRSEDEPAQNLGGGEHFNREREVEQQQHQQQQQHSNPVQIVHSAVQQNPLPSSHIEPEVVHMEKAIHQEPLRYRQEQPSFLRKSEEVVNSNRPIYSTAQPDVLPKVQPKVAEHLSYTNNLSIIQKQREQKRRQQREQEKASLKEKAQDKKKQLEQNQKLNKTIQNDKPGVKIGIAALATAATVGACVLGKTDKRLSAAAGIASFIIAYFAQK